MLRMLSTFRIIFARIEVEPRWRFLYDDHPELD